MEESKKPPVGIKPRWLHDSQRARDIIDAIERYTEANMTIPKIWIDELRDLCECPFISREMNDEDELYAKALNGIQNYSKSKGGAQ